jgi:putative sugar O-methyltransferase
MPRLDSYVTRYLREDYGTIDQLRKGIQDHRPEEPISHELLDRLIRSWQAMKADAIDTPPAYRLGGEWQAIVSRVFSPLLDAFETGNRDALNEHLQNFIRWSGTYFGEPTKFTARDYERKRCDHFRIFASRWLDLYGEESIEDAMAPLIGNPLGFVIEGSLFNADGFRKNFYARRMVDLLDDVEAPVVCEVGGGFGSFAHQLLRREENTFRYIDYDIPVMSLVAAYYSISALPEKRILLYGEVDSLAEPLRDCDAAFLPNFALPQLEDLGADLCFNTCSFSEMDEATVQEYMGQFARISRRFILHEDHSWISGSRNAAYQPDGGFQHWNLSRVEPPPDRFKRMHRIPAPFNSDEMAEFFEWLYMRR